MSLSFFVPGLNSLRQATSAVLQVFATFILAVSSVWFTIPLSIVATALFGCVQVVVAIVAPAVLVWAQRFKKLVPSWLLRKISC
jgi:hypothetical protein